MYNAKSGITAAVVASTMILCSSCSDDKVRYVLNKNTGQEELVGTVTLEELKNYYIIKVRNNLDQSECYMTYKYDSEIPELSYSDFLLIGKEDVIVATRYNSSLYISDFGTVESICRIYHHISDYSTLKQKYNIKEVEEIYDKLVNEYYKENTKAKTFIKN